MNLYNKKVLVTGGGSGYGKGIARVLKDAGAVVWISGRNEPKLAKAAEELGVRYMAADVASGADWDRVLDAMGGIDVLVNNAGAGGRIGPVAEQGDVDIVNTITTNLTGTILGCSHASRRIIAAGKGGAIVNVSSVCAMYAWPGWSVYTAAKAGLAKFSHGLYTELRPHGIRVMCLTPSWGQTDFNAAAGIRGASEDPELAGKCTAPEELGRIVKEMLETPDHLAVSDLTVLPMIQDISPM